jgi:8-oxo-dGTP diphosphatase
VSRASGAARTPVEVALVVPLAGDRLLVARREPGSSLAGLWEFPGGKIADGEEPAAAARRELGEETGLVAEVLEPLLVVAHGSAEPALRLHVFLARRTRGAAHPRWVWKTLDEVGALDMPEANARILAALRGRPA